MLAGAGGGGRGRGLGGFPFSPKSALLITRVIIQQVPQPSAWLRSHAGAFPHQQTRLLPRAPAKQPHPERFGGGVGEWKEEVDICDFKRTLAQWLMLNPRTVRVSDNFPPRKLAILWVFLERYPASTGTRSKCAHCELFYVRGNPDLCSL